MPKVVFEYNYNGHDYLGAKFSFAPELREGFLTQDKAAKLNAQLAPGVAVAVYVNPDNANESCLVKGDQTQNKQFVSLIAGMLLDAAIAFSAVMLGRYTVRQLQARKLEQLKKK